MLGGLRLFILIYVFNIVYFMCPLLYYYYYYFVRREALRLMILFYIWYCLFNVLFC